MAEVGIGEAVGIGARPEQSSEAKDRSPATATSATSAPVLATPASVSATSTASTPASASASTSAPAASGYGRLPLALILTAVFMVVLDFSIVNVALASIQRELGFDASSVQWIVTGYAITFGGFLVLGGRATICTAGAGFSGAACSCSPSPHWPEA